MNNTNNGPVYMTAEQLRASRDIQERLAAPSPWLRDAVVVKPVEISASTVAIETAEELRAQYDTQERLQSPSPWLSQSLT